MAKDGSPSRVTGAQLQSLLARALALHRQGQLAEAKAIYESILQQDARHFDALNLLGTVALQTGNFDAAVEIFAKAIKVNPDIAATHLNRARALESLGRLPEALTSYGRALALTPDDVDAHCNRANLLLGLGRLGEALAGYDKTLALRPDLAPAHNNRGNVLTHLGRLAEALASYDRALALAPGNVLAHNNRGSALHSLGQLDEALASYDRALALKPDYADAHFNRGFALYHMRLLDEALASYEQAIALQPNHIRAYHNRGNVLFDLKRLEEALDSYETALAINPDGDFLLGTVLHVRMRMCDWLNFDTTLEKLRASVAGAKRACLPFHLLALVDEPELHKHATAVYSEAVYPRASSLGRLAKHARGEKIRIGYYSGDFHAHAVAYLVAELFEVHDRSKFEIYGFSFGPNTSDEMQSRISAAFHCFIDVAGMTNKAVAQLSRERGIDIAVDLNGHTQDARSGMFAEVCAPIQLSYLGYPGTMGMACFDYIVADRIVVPPERHGDFTEKIISLPHSYQVNDTKRKIAETTLTRVEFGLPKEGFVFCCFNNNYKIVPRVFDIWMRLLKGVEGSVLWLFQDNAAAARNLRREAAVRGVDGMRLVFARHMPHAKHLARHRLADLFLDTLPYNAHTTASDALWAGLPVLTCTGKSFAARVATSLLHAVDMSELVTDSLEAYEAKALELATNPSMLADIRHKLAERRLSTPLFDATQFARHLEAAYTSIYERYQAGLEPESFKVS